MLGNIDQMNLHDDGDPDGDIGPRSLGVVAVVAAGLALAVAGGMLLTGTGTHCVADKSIVNVVHPRSDKPAVPDVAPAHQVPPPSAPAAIVPAPPHPVDVQVLIDPNPVAPQVYPTAVAPPPAPVSEAQDQPGPPGDQPPADG
ncbi:hypothetical protein ACIP5Y_09100 [Nocardia sp. NPDC088792]|uniref:hypothetical protein n=1 Tax=Nocardia sp. NPDC088792 TaxID=3364332 RepID=UPI00382624F4